MKAEILEKAEDIKEYLTMIRRYIHQHPELGLEEFKTSALVKRELESIGIEVVNLKSGTGVLGIMEGDKQGQGKVIGLRADMDALPILEQTGLPYSSEREGVMHACGHDGHTAGLLGAARLLGSMRDRFSGTVKFIFQPAEELLEGAKSMVKAGVLENPKVDVILALHSWPELEAGMVGVFAGPYMASADRFTIRVVGKGGHGAYPQKSADPVLAAAHLIVGLQSIVSREIDALDNLVISVCTVHGGKTFNVIPEEVSLGGTVRCRDASVRGNVEGKVNRIAKGITSSFGCRHEMEYSFGVPPLINDPKSTALLKKAADIVLGPGHAVDIDRPAMGSEDFSLFIETVGHGAFAKVGLGRSEEEPMLIHNDRFDFNDEVLPIWAAILAQAVLLNNG